MDERIIEELDTIHTTIKLLNLGKKYNRPDNEYLMLFDVTCGRIMVYLKKSNLLKYNIKNNNTKLNYGRESFNFDEQIEMLNEIKKLL
ncbi:hypothetical protein D3C81_1407120 [compost metagenome]